MGASDFLCRGYGADIRQAFNAAVKDAQHWHGYRGYTGTSFYISVFEDIIAEKGEVIAFEVPEGLTPEHFASLVQALTYNYESYNTKHSGSKPGVELMDFYREGGRKLGGLWDSLTNHQQAAIVDAFRRTDDKWGPAGCVCVGRTEKCGDDNVFEYIFFGWASE